MEFEKWLEANKNEKFEARPIGALEAKNRYSTQGNESTTKYVSKSEHQAILQMEKYLKSCPQIDDVEFATMLGGSALDVYRSIAVEYYNYFGDMVYDLREFGSTIFARNLASKRMMNEKFEEAKNIKLP